MVGKLYGLGVGPGDPEAFDLEGAASHQGK